MGIQQTVDPFFVSPGTDLMSGVICGLPRLWSFVGNAETRFFADELADIAIDRPVYVTGLARAGSTILLEALAGAPGIATHQYRDFPLVMTPLLSDRLSASMASGDQPATERAHADGIMVTPESPEAMEEAVWMAFFRHLHAPGQSHLLDRDTKHPAFEQFYRDHIRKLILAREGERYVAKGNYNIARLRYLLCMFPDARFVIPVRSPESHIASLIKQQALFTKHCAQNPRARRHLRRVGHFEFGPDRTAINVGDDAIARQVDAHWSSGDEVRGWAAYWHSIYDFVLAQIAADDALRAATTIVRYEDLCATPAETLQAIAVHCELKGADAALAVFADSIQAPRYYRPHFTDEERAIIRQETAETAARLGYETYSASSA